MNEHLIHPQPVNPEPEDDNDDEMVGTLLSRRHALRLLGLGGGAALSAGGLLAGHALAQRTPGGTGGGTSAGSSGAGSLPGCVVRPAQTEGPYFVDEKLNRSDLRKDSVSGQARPGIPLTLDFVVSRVAVGGCTPRGRVMIDVWQCDALGVYSDVSGNTDDFLRGYQLTNAAGRARFTTIYPGWYPGRAVHIHFKLRPLDASGKPTGEFTSQLFFPESVTDAAHAVAPYRNKGRRNTLNSTDSIYRNGGSQLLLNLSGTPQAGYRATFDIGLNIG